MPNSHQVIPKKNSSAVPHVICMVGLPARGKTYISKKLARYLNWIGVTTKVFNVGEYRRQTEGYRDHEFFRTDNPEAMAVRHTAAMSALTDAIEWLKNLGEVAIFDATNTTVERRKMVYDEVVTKNSFKCIYLESICDDEHLIETNIVNMKIRSPDYQNNNMDVTEAIDDFRRRISHYTDVYVPIDEATEGHATFIKVVNAGEKMIINKHYGYLQSRIAYWLMNIHLVPRTIYLTRHGESINNVAGKIGGDSDLSDHGMQFADALAELINRKKIPGIRVWTSWLKRSIKTAAAIDAPQERWKALNELDSGVCEGLTYDEMCQKYPEQFAARDLNKLTYRYQGGESYEDLVARLEPVIMELERGMLW